MMNQINKVLFLFCMTLVCSGCVWVNNVPEDNVDFSKVERLSDLDGTYQNRGEGAHSEINQYLSELIWPEEPIKHPLIKFIEVKAVSDNSIRVRALGENKFEEKVATFVKNKDFHFNSGRIQLKTKIGYDPLSPVIGPYYEGAELGLDQHGQGKYKGSSSIAGLAMGLIPIVAGGSDEVRFIKIK